jgi:hypothetical protein
MAGLGYIMAREEQVDIATGWIEDLFAAFAAECSLTTNGKVKPANKATWKSARASVEVLHRACELFLKATAEKARGLTDGNS